MAQGQPSCTRACQVETSSCTTMSPDVLLAYFVQLLCHMYLYELALCRVIPLQVALVALKAKGPGRSCACFILLLQRQLLQC